jgi:ATP-dependent HslUV protease ATP-binding subunit HslU
MRAEDAAEDRILDILVPPPRHGGAEFGFAASAAPPRTTPPARSCASAARRRAGRQGDRAGTGRAPANVDIVTPPGMEEMAEQLKGLFSQMGTAKKTQRKLKMAEALRQLTDEEAAKLVNEDEIKARALHNAEQNGIVFIDEIDKVATRSNTQGSDVSRQGVQRDLLPLVEGTTVQTKHGMVKTDHILFIASGAFHLAKPSDLIPELQGRFPIRVELQALSVDDFQAILSSTHANLVRQYQACWPPRASRWRSRRTASAAWPRSPSRSTSAPRTSARAAWPR